MFMMEMVVDSLSIVWAIDNYGQAPKCQLEEIVPNQTRAYEI